MKPTDILKPTDISLDDFIQKLNSKIEQNVTMQGGVYQITDQLNCLFYVLTRTKEYQNWNVRENRIKELQKQKKEWFLILLSVKSHPSFLLTANDVSQIIKTEGWKKNSKGDYKTTKPSLKDKNKFNTIEEFKNKIDDKYKEQSKEQFEKEVEGARKLPQEERLNKMQNYPEYPSLSEKKVIVYNRNPYVVAEVLERAKGKCQYCMQNAPFNRISDGTPFLEIHHVVFLSAGGKDTIDNTIALCPNCHKGVHHGGIKICISEKTNR